MLNSSAFGQTKELEMYNEWFVEDSTFSSERPFFIIRDSIFFNNFWKYTKLGGGVPYLDFDRFMVLVWAPGSTRQDLSKVNFERILYKEGCLLILMDLADNYRKFGANKKPLKFVILPKVKPCDLFFYKKIKKGWRKYEWKHFYTYWDMSGDRSRPFDIVLMDKEKDVQIVLATYTPELDAPKNEENKADENIQIAQNTSESKSRVKPVTIVSTRPIENRTATIDRERPQSPLKPPTAERPFVPNQTSTQTQSGNSLTNFKEKIQNQNQSKQSGFVSTAPIDMGGGSKSSTESSTKRPEVAPGMAEDPLFGSEFDITF